MASPIPAEELRCISRIVDVALAPDGERLAFIASEFDAEDDETYQGLYVVPTDGSESPHRLTRRSSASAVRWSPTGRYLGFLASREADQTQSIETDPDELAVDEPTDDEAGSPDEDADDEPEQQVWTFDLERGGDAIQRTDRDHGVRQFDWGPDEERIVIAARDPTEDQEEYLDQREDDGPIEIDRLQHKADGVGYTDNVRTYLFVVDLASGELRRLDEAYGAGAYEPLHGLQPAWSPTGDSIAFVSNRTERPDDSAIANVFIVDAQTGELERLTDLEYGLNTPSWSPDGDKLVVHGTPATNWYVPADVMTVDIASGGITTLTESVSATVSWFGAPKFLDTDTAVAIMGEDGWSRLYTFDVNTGEATPITGPLDREQSLRLFDCQEDTVAITISDPAAGHDVFIQSAEDLERQTATQVTELNSAFVHTRPMPECRRLKTDAGEHTVESMLYYPESFDPDDPDPHPVLLWMHGGPMSYDDPEFSFDFAYFTSRGYVICKPNYRGSTSYGREFAEVLRGKWGTVEVEDMLSVTRDLIDRDIADPDRLFSMGFSYGGISTGYLITQSDHFAAAVAEHGIYDLRSDFGTGDSQAWMSEEFGLPWDADETYDAASSITDVEGVTTPTLITAGGVDWRCPPGQSEQLYVALRKQGVDAKLIIYPNEHHNIQKPERAIHRLEAIADWFETHDPTTQTE